MFPWSRRRSFRAGLDFRKKDTQYKKDQKDRRHRVHTASYLPEHSAVWVNTQGRDVPGTVSQSLLTPRSYLVDTPTGMVRRNRSQLRARAENMEREDVTESTTSATSDTSTSATTTTYFDISHSNNSHFDICRIDWHFNLQPFSQPKSSTLDHTGTTVLPPNWLRY